MFFRFSGPFSKYKMFLTVFNGLIRMAMVDSSGEVKSRNKLIGSLIWYQCTKKIHYNLRIPFSICFCYFCLCAMKKLWLHGIHQSIHQLSKQKYSHRSSSFFCSFPQNDSIFVIETHILLRKNSPTLWSWEFYSIFLPEAPHQTVEISV